LLTSAGRKAWRTPNEALYIQLESQPEICWYQYLETLAVLHTEWRQTCINEIKVSKDSRITSATEKSRQQKEGTIPASATGQCDSLDQHQVWTTVQSQVITGINVQ